MYVRSGFRTLAGRMPSPYEPSMKWTSPRDQLPPSGENVLVADHHGDSLRVARFNLANPADLRALENIGMWLLIPVPVQHALQPGCPGIWDQALTWSA